MNVEFVIVLDTHRPPTSTADELKHLILSKEQSILDEHPETSNIAATQMELF